MTGKQIFVDNLTRILAELGMSGNEFARRVGIAEKTINNFLNAIERDRSISLDYIDDIARYLKVPTWMLFISGFSIKAAKNKNLETLINGYEAADEKGKDQLISAAERELEFKERIDKLKARA